MKKSYFRKMLTYRWLRWVAVRAICTIYPSFAKRFFIPRDFIDVRSAASHILEDTSERVTLKVSDHLRDVVLTQSRFSDTGDVSTYDERASHLISICAIVPDCAVNGRTMAVIHQRSGSLVFNTGEGKPLWNSTKVSFLERREADKDVTYVPLTSGGQYYHFFADEVLPLLYFLRKYKDQIGKMRILYPADCPVYVTDVLTAISRSEASFSFEKIGAREVLTGATVLHARRCMANGERLAFERVDVEALKRMLANFYNDKKLALSPDSKKIYISRKGARLRQLHNERELIRSLEDLSFSTFVPGSGNHPDQINLFSNADVIVAVHGAALTNLLFCKPGTIVIEIFAANHVVSSYIWLAHQLGLRYGAVIGGKNDLSQSFSVSVEKVISEIRVAETSKGQGSLLPI